MRVGTRQNNHTEYTQGRDHPHACGDKSVNFSLISSGTGSSPCVWGQASTASTATSPAGIIPMRVGTSNLLQIFRRSR